MKIKRQILITGLLIGATACSNGEDGGADKEVAAENANGAATSPGTAPQTAPGAATQAKKRNSDKPPLNAEAEAEALSIREAANKAAALVEADAAQVAAEQ